MLHSSPTGSQHPAQRLLTQQTAPLTAAPRQPEPPLTNISAPVSSTFPSGVREVLAHLDTLSGRVGLPDDVSRSLAQTIRSVTDQSAGASPADAALIASLLEQSPEVERLSAWIASGAIPGVPLPHHPGCLSLLGVLYFFARVLKDDPLVVTRAIDAYSLERTSPARRKLAEELNSRFSATLVRELKECTSITGPLIAGELDDTNSMSSSQFLAGVLAPLFTEMKALNNGPSYTGLHRWLPFGRNTDSQRSVPRHLTDLGLTDTIDADHVKALHELHQTHTEARAETAKAEETARREQEQRAHEAAATNNVNAWREKVAKAKGQETLRAEGEILRFLRPLSDQGEGARIKGIDEFMCRSVFEVLRGSPGLGDDVLYALIERLPRTLRMLEESALDPAIEEANTVLRRRRNPDENSWRRGGKESLPVATLWLALSKVSVITNPKRFETVHLEVMNFMEDAHHSSLFGRWPRQFLSDMKEAVVALHLRKLRQSLPVIPAESAPS